MDILLTRENIILTYHKHCSGGLIDSGRFKFSQRLMYHDHACTCQSSHHNLNNTFNDVD